MCVCVYARVHPSVYMRVQMYNFMCEASVAEIYSDISLQVFKDDSGRIYIYIYIYMCVCVCVCMHRILYQIYIFIYVCILYD